MEARGPRRRALGPCPWLGMEGTLLGSSTTGPARGRGGNAGKSGKPSFSPPVCSAKKPSPSPTLPGTLWGNEVEKASLVNGVELDIEMNKRSQLTEKAKQKVKVLINEVSQNSPKTRDLKSAIFVLLLQMPGPVPRICPVSLCDLRQVAAPL